MVYPLLTSNQAFVHFIWQPEFSRMIRMMHGLLLRPELLQVCTVESVIGKYDPEDFMGCGVRNHRILFPLLPIHDAKRAR